MRVLALLLVLVFGSVAFGQDNRSVRDEIVAVTEAYNEAWETADMVRVSNFHVPDFRYWWHGRLSAATNEEFITEYTRIMSTTKEWSMETGGMDVQVISPEAAIVSFVATSTHLITTEGQSYDYGVGAFTYVWQKLEGEWKLLHIHESAPDENSNAE